MIKHYAMWFMQEDPLLPSRPAAEVVAAVAHALNNCVIPFENTEMKPVKEMWNCAEPIQADAKFVMYDERAEFGTDKLVEHGKQPFKPLDPTPMAWDHYIFVMIGLGSIKQAFNQIEGDPAELFARTLLREACSAHEFMYHAHFRSPYAVHKTLGSAFDFQKPLANDRLYFEDIWDGRILSQEGLSLSITDDLLQIQEIKRDRCQKEADRLLPEVMKTERFIRAAKEFNQAITAMV